MQLSGNAFDYFIVFWAGVLVSFTPCVYPVLPLTASFIAAADGKGTKLKGFILSTIFVLGLAITYSTLAVFAALTGKVFGNIQNNPVIIFFVSGALTFFALVMFDVIPFLHFGVDVQKHIKPKNAWAIFLSGMASGLVIGPCTAPILGTLLLYVASKQNILHGVSLVFVFSYGVGTSLIIVGTFSGLLGSLPKSGLWLLRVKHFCGIILFIGAAYFLFKAVTLFLG